MTQSDTDAYRGKKYYEYHQIEKKYIILHFVMMDNIVKASPILAISGFLFSKLFSLKIADSRRIVFL